MLRQSFNLLTGASGIGKSALIATMARCLRDGTAFFGHQPNPVVDIGIVLCDRGAAHGCDHWFGLAGFPDIPRYSLGDDLSYKLPGFRRKFERTQRLFEMVDKLKLRPGSVLFVDPIGFFMGGNLLDYDSCALAAMEIQQALKLRDLTIAAGAMHTAKLRKAREDRYLRLQDQILGSSALVGFSDTQFYLASPEELGRSVYGFLIAPHVVKQETLQLERDDKGLFRMAAGADAKSCERIIDLFPRDGTPTTLGELTERAQAIPYTMKTVQRALEQLIADSRVVRIKRGHYTLAHVLH